jgi:hypothetical protein
MSTLPAEGGCRCGKLRFKVSKAPMMVVACHCRGCQRMASSAFSLTAIIPADGFEVTQGEPVIGGLHGASKHYFCGYCMSWLFTRPEQMDTIVNLRPTMLDEPQWNTPFVETCVSAKLSWVQTGAVYSFDEYPPESEYARLMQEYGAE